jgi:hypothetical protein
MDTERDRLNELESDIKATGEDLVDDALEVVKIEKEKVALAPDDPARPALAQKAEAVAARMAKKTKLEKQLVDEAKRVE